ncbi:MAG: hypothetical protein U1D99_03765, partial [Candidatus Omnitrophota bacterium]|nr:hypothetical protein [Candidatus Omnitrophota bacterium]
WPLQYLVTLHPKDIPECLEKRSRFGGNVDFREVITHDGFVRGPRNQPISRWPGVTLIVEFEPPSGSSALHGVMAGLKLGYRKIIMVGCPLTNEPERGKEYDNFQVGWRVHQERYIGRVKSMSGWTMGYLGSPTEEWLNMVTPNLVIAGAAPCAQDDIARISDWRADFDFMTIGRGGICGETLPRLSCHVSHENDFSTLKEKRQARGLNTNYLTFSNNSFPEVDNVVADIRPPTCSFDCNPRLPSKDPRNMHHYSGSSAMLGLKVGLRLNYKKIILAGVTLDVGHYTAFQVGWSWIADLLRYCPVRAMSGYTMELLGYPTEEWINDI